MVSLNSALSQMTEVKQYLSNCQHRYIYSPQKTHHVIIMLYISTTIASVQQGWSDNNDPIGKEHRALLVPLCSSQITLLVC